MGYGEELQMLASEGYAHVASKHYALGARCYNNSCIHRRLLQPRDWPRELNVHRQAVLRRGLEPESNSSVSVASRRL